MTKKEVEKIIEEEALISDYNLLEDRPDRENEDALDRFLSKLRAIKTQKYEQLFCNKGANRVLRITITKTFVSRHDFEATYHELYKSKDGKLFSVTRIDPAPGGYGEEYMYIKDVYELDIDEEWKIYSDEELLQLVFSEGEKVELR